MKGVKCSTVPDNPPWPGRKALARWERTPRETAKNTVHEAQPALTRAVRSKLRSRVVALGRTHHTGVEDA